MSILQKLSFALVGTAVILMGAHPASAVSLVIGGSTPSTTEGQTTNIQGATTINFDDGTAPTSGPVSFSAQNGNINSDIVQGNISNLYAAPYNDTSKYLAIQPNNSVTITFAQALNDFGFYWGSVDAYNSVQVYSQNTLLSTFSGANVPGAPANGEQSGNANNVYVNLLADTNETFDKIVLSTTQPAFETDNYSYRLASVPEPSSILGLLAFGAISAGSFVKRKSKLA